MILLPQPPSAGITGESYYIKFNVAVTSHDTSLGHPFLLTGVHTREQFLCYKTFLLSTLVDNAKLPPIGIASISWPLQV